MSLSEQPQQLLPMSLHLPCEVPHGHRHQSTFSTNCFFSSQTQGRNVLLTQTFRRAAFHLIIDVQAATHAHGNNLDISIFFCVHDCARQISCHDKVGIS